MIMFRAIILLVALISFVVGKNSQRDELPPLPAPIGCKSVGLFDECVRPAANAMLCSNDDVACICSGYRIERGCYTSYCPGNSWEYEDRGTSCGPTTTAAPKASTTKAGAPYHAGATPTQETYAKGNTQKFSAASKAGAAVPAASSQINGGAYSPIITISGLVIMAAAALTNMIPR